MTNQYSPRPAGSLVHVAFQFDGMRTLAAGRAGDMKRADPAIRKTHEFLAEEMQKLQAAALVDSVQGFGRAQRTAVRGGPLYEAIKSAKNRTVNLDGFTVGYLSDKGKFPHVADYAAGLERGTDIHLTSVSGLRLQGLWIVPGGRNGLQAPSEGAKNALGFRGRYVTVGGFPITKAIEGYRYQQQGHADWVAKGYAGGEAIAAYTKFFKLGGLDFAARLWSRLGIQAGASQISSKYVQG